MGSLGEFFYVYEKHSFLVVDTLEPIAPLITAVGIGIGALKVAQTAAGWMKGLNAVMSANPAVAVATGILGVSTALFLPIHFGT